MDKIKRFFKTAWDRLKARWIGFFLLIPVAISSFIVPFVYMSGFLRTDYMSAWAVILPFSAVAVFALAFFKPTARYAPFAVFAAVLLSLLVFVKTSYMHLSTAFFGGINGNVFVQAGFSFSFCTIVYVLNIILCVAAMFFRQYRDEKEFYGTVCSDIRTPLPSDRNEEAGK